jgi:hypothetical protein
MCTNKRNKILQCRNKKPSTISNSTSKTEERKRSKEINTEEHPILHPKILNTAMRSKSINMSHTHSIPLALHNNIQLMPDQSLLIQVRIVGHQSIRTLHIRIIIQPPVRCPDLPRRVEQPRPYVVHD